ncbi:MAG TPA: DinB family protein [Armatimonadota bacterium]|jgi:uncharacterized damage-inducible protein DinB
MPSEIETGYVTSWDELKEALDGIGADEAAAFRHPHWPKHDDWAGDDGSISGIVFHVAAWKETYAEGLETGAWGDEKAVKPDTDSWPGRLQWLEAQHERLLAALRHLEQDEATSVLISDRPYTLAAIYHDSMGHHDVYHAAQINYLRQRYAAERG